MILQFKITKQVDIKRQGGKLIFYNNLFKQNKITKNIEVLIIVYYNKYIVCHTGVWRNIW